MKHKALLVLLILVIALSPFAYSEAADIGITIDSSKVEFNSQIGYPFIDSNSRTQVPFRATMEEFGCLVSWEQLNQTAVAIKDGTTVRVPIGQNYIYVNGVKVPNDTSALIKESRTYLPIRVVLEAFGASVGWDAKEQTVIVNTTPSPKMTVHFIDVGQGDSVFIDFLDFEILIDAGGNGSGSMVANYIRPYVQGNLEIIVATHAHEDHIGGLDTVINYFQVDNIIDSGETSTTITYSDYYAAASSEMNCNFMADSNLTFDMGNEAFFYIIELGDDYSNTNNNSVISMLTYNNIEMLFMGDLESTIENANLSRFEDVDLLKAGHHGSNTSSSAPFLNVVKPEITIISAGLNNQYGHPHQEAINRMIAVGSSVYGTYKSGTIIVTTDGYTQTLNTSAKITSSTIVQDSNPLPTTVIVPVPTSGTYVGSSKSDKYHYPTCRYVDSISVANLVYFKSKEEAQNRGYVPCKVCNP